MLSMVRDCTLRGRDEAKAGTLAHSLFRADGADCVMLSGETAKGKYPTEAVRTMNEIVLASESFATSGALGHPTNEDFVGDGSTDSATARAAVAAATERDCSAILVLTNHGTLPPLVSAYRPSMPIISFCPDVKVCRQLQVYRAIHPIVGEFSIEDATKKAVEMGYVKSGDEVVIAYSKDDSSGHTVTMEIAHAP